MGSRIVHSLWLIAVDPHRGGSISLRPLEALNELALTVVAVMVLFAVVNVTIFNDHSVLLTSLDWIGMHL
jgi:hypothetical protein